MRWKMSVDLSRPWVRSEGNLDPIDGYVTYRLVQEAADQLDAAAGGGDGGEQQQNLSSEISGAAEAKAGPSLPVFFLTAGASMDQRLLSSVSAFKRNRRRHPQACKTALFR